MVATYITVSSGKRITKVNVDDIFFVERNLRKLRIVTAKEEIEFYQRLDEITPFLDQRFYPCLKGCYINFEQVKSMEEQRIIFEEDKCFYLGRANFMKTKQAYKKYWKNRNIPPYGAAVRKNIADVILEFYGIARNNPEIADFLADQMWYPVKTPPQIKDDYKKMLLKISEGKE